MTSRASEHQLLEELSRRARLELSRPRKPEFAGLVTYSKTTNHVKIGNLRLNRSSGSFAVMRDVPPTRGIVMVYTESWNTKESLHVGSEDNILWALNILRKRQVLDDLADV